MITAENGAHKITRNSSFFKAISDQCGSLQTYHTDTQTDTSGGCIRPRDINPGIPGIILA